jgi:hypothetical protein
METRIPGRQTILPPQPSRSLALFALLSALWFGLAGALSGRIDALVRWARDRFGARFSPDLVDDTGSEPRTGVLRAYSGTQLMADASMQKTRPFSERVTCGERNRA